MSDPPSPSLVSGALFFFPFYPARRRSDRWAINELKRPSFFFGQPLALFVRRTAACFAVTFAPPLVPLAIPTLRTSILSRSLFLSLELSLALFFPRIRALFLPLPVSPVFRVRSTLPAVLRARTSLSAYLILSPFPPPSPHLIRYRPPPPTSSTSCDSRPFRSSSNSPFHGREKRTGSCPSRTLFHPTFLRLPAFGLSDPAIALFFSFSLLFLSFQHWTGHSSLSGFPWGSHTRTRGHVYASHIYAPERMQIPRFAFSHRQINLAGAYVW